MHYRKLLFFIFIFSLLSFSLLNPAIADTSHEGDITLTGNDVLVIEDTTYTQTGNIYVKDNAKLTIRNSTLIFNQRYHEEFQIWVQGNGTFEVQNSTIQTGILPGENYEIYVSDEASVSISDSDLASSSGYLILDAICRGSTTVSKSQVHNLNINFTSSGGSSLSVLDSEVYTVALSLGDHQGDFSDLRPGFFQYWTYKQGAYEITLENTNIGDWSIRCDPNSQIIIRDSDFSALGCRGFSSISLLVIDSIIGVPVIHGFNNGCSVQLSNLRTGLHGQWSLRDHATGDCIPDIILENTEITQGWLVSSFGANLSIDNSNIGSLRSYASGQVSPDDITSVSNSTIEQLMFYYSNARLIFDNTTIREVMVNLPSNSIIEGNITFTHDAYVSYWLDSTIKRIYPVLLEDSNGNIISNASLSLYSKNDDLLWTGVVTDSEGKASFEIEFNDDNYTDAWKLVIEYDSERVNKEIKFLSSTPIGLNDPPTADAGSDQTVFVGSTVNLDGSGSSDADGNALTYQWSFLSRPGGSVATLSEPSDLNPIFEVDLSGAYVVQLIVNDGTVDSDPDTVTIAGVEHGGGGGSCFIATAAYGSPLEPHVKVLRDFRDRFMVNTCVGKTFIDLYNTYSPPVADFIARHDTLRALVRWSLLPVVGMSWMAINLGPISSLVFILLFLSLISSITVVLSKRICQRENRA